MKKLFWWLTVLFLAGAYPRMLAQDGDSATAGTEKKPARFFVKGAGPLKNLVLKQQLKAIFNENNPTFDSTEIEDAALIIISYSSKEGYLETTATAEITWENGEILQVEWDKNMDVLLPRDVQATRVVFDLHRGPKFYYASLEANEIRSMSYHSIEEFFYSEPYFFQSPRSKTFTPYLFNAGARNLRIHLNNQGFRLATVQHEVLAQNDETGAVDTRITIKEGPLHLLNSVRVFKGKNEEIPWDMSAYLGRPYSDFLRQDIIQELRNAYFEKGHVFVEISHEFSVKNVNAERAEVSLTIHIVEGKQVRISEIEFQGNVDVKTKLLEDQLTLESGDLLNPSELDGTRLNISRLGLFQKVDYRLEKETETESRLIFDLVERSGWQVDTLAGWGSYEQLRLGITAEQLNTLGRGHRLQLKSIISQKSLQGETRYMIPDLFKSNYPFSSKLFYLEREELSFDRNELGIDLRTFTYIESWDLDLDLRYTYQRLQARDNQLSTITGGENNVRAGSVETRINRNTRDNPLNPTSGYRFFGNVEWAAKPLGGQVDYQRAELGIAYSAEIHRGLIWHGSFSHGVIGSFSFRQSQIPTNKFFFPGGDSSIRGYQRGEAAPRDALGEFTGATSYALLNLELEQKLSGIISLVGFVDTLAMASEITQYPFDEYLYSAGLGIRFETIMGPIRFEYGRNLNPRPLDPGGTFHFSLGYPF